MQYIHNESTNLGKCYLTPVPRAMNISLIYLCGKIRFFSFSMNQLPISTYLKKGEKKYYYDPAISDKEACLGIETKYLWREHSLDSLTHHKQA